VTQQQLQIQSLQKTNKNYGSADKNGIREVPRGTDCFILYNTKIS